MAGSRNSGSPGRLAAAAVLVSAVFFFAPPYTSAGVMALTLDEAYGLALANHERVAIAGETVNQARSDLRKAVSRVLPTVTAEAGYTRYTESRRSGEFTTQPESSASAELRLTQPLYSGGREWAVQRQAKLQIRSSSAGLEGAKELVMLDTSRAYYGVLKAQREVEIQRAALRRAGERLEVAVARLRVGDVTRSAVLRAEAEKAGAEAQLIRAANGLQNAKELLRRITGAADEEVSVIEPPVLASVELTPGELVKKALAERSDYAQRALEEQAAAEGIAIARAGFKPSLKLEGQYVWRGQDPMTTFFQEESASGTLRFTYPLFEGFLRKAELTGARSGLREAELRRLGLRRDIEVQVREALNNLNAIDALVESFRRQLAFAEEDYKMVFEQFKFGVAATLDVIDAENTLVSAQSSLASAVYDLELAKIDLKYVTGALVQGPQQ